MNLIFLSFVISTCLSFVLMSVKTPSSAYLSLKRNMPWLWTFQDYPLSHLPNTNNAPEGVFTDIKTKLMVHSGITKDRRVALIQEYIARHY